MVRRYDWVARAVEIVRVSGMGYYEFDGVERYSFDSLYSIISGRDTEYIL